VNEYKNSSTIVRLKQVLDRLFRERVGEEFGSEVRSVVAHDVIDGYAPRPELEQSRGLFIVVGFEVHDLAVAIDWGCPVLVDRLVMRRWCHRDGSTGPHIRGVCGSRESNAAGGC